MGKQKVGFQLTPEAIEVLEEAKWVLRKSKNQILEELILKHLKPLIKSSGRKKGGKRK